MPPPVEVAVECAVECAVERRELGRRGQAAVHTEEAGPEEVLHLLARKRGHLVQPPRARLKFRGELIHVGAMRGAQRTWCSADLYGGNLTRHDGRFVISCTFRHQLYELT